MFGSVSSYTTVLAVSRNFACHEKQFFKRLNQNYPNYMEFWLNWTSKCWSRSMLSVCLFSNLSIPDIFCHPVHFSEFLAILAGAALLWYKFA